MRFALAAVLAFILIGCTSTRSETVSVERTQGVTAGQPTDLTTVRQERAKSETDVNVDLGPAISAAVAAATGDLKGAVKGIAEQVGQLNARPQPVQADELAKLISASADAGGLDPATGGALGAAGGALLLALREWAAHRQTKRDADEGWELAMKRRDDLPARHNELPTAKV